MELIKADLWVEMGQPVELVPANLKDLANAFVESCKRFSIVADLYNQLAKDFADDNCKVLKCQLMVGHALTSSGSFDKGEQCCRFGRMENERRTTSVLFRDDSPSLLYR